MVEKCEHLEFLAQLTDQLVHSSASPQEEIEVNWYDFANVLHLVVVVTDSEDRCLFVNNFGLAYTTEKYFGLKYFEVFPECISDMITLAKDLEVGYLALDNYLVNVVTLDRKKLYFIKNLSDERNLQFLHHKHRLLFYLQEIAKISRCQTVVFVHPRDFVVVGREGLAFSPAEIRQKVAELAERNETIWSDYKYSLYCFNVGRVAKLVLLYQELLILNETEKVLLQYFINCLASMEDCSSFTEEDDNLLVF